jgi:hypothetical protein
MERIDYAQLIEDILTKHSVNDLNFDQKRHHYQVLNIGWQEQKRIYGVVIYVDLKGDKIWIKRDGTEVGIANELLEAGVPKQDIVLGFNAPYKRQFTDFAVS